MATKLYATSGDTNKLVNATLQDDGVAVDLSAVTAIECHVRNRSTGTLTTITGLTGTALGVVATTIPGPLNAGVFTIEWEVTDGTTITTYPGSESARPLLFVRQEADGGAPEPAGGWWAADVGIVDAGAYYTGTDVEAALQEVGADLAALPSQYATLADPYSPFTKPVYLDQYWSFFRGVGYTAGGTTTASTITSATAGLITFDVADGSQFVAGEAIVVASGTSQQQICLILSVAGNTITTHGRAKFSWASGTAVGHLWENDTHPLDSVGYTAMAYWLANLRMSAVPGIGQTLFAGGDMASTYTDALSEASVPVLWESITPASTTFLASSWVTGVNPHSRRGAGAYFSSSASGAGVRTLPSIPVTPGQVIAVTGHIKATAGIPKFAVVDKNVTSTELASVLIGDISSTGAENQNHLGTTAKLRFLVPPGVRDIEIRITQSTATAASCYFDGIRVLVDSNATIDDTRYLFDRLDRPVVWLGDSWGLNLYAKLETALTTRYGSTVTVSNAAVSGERLDQMVTRIATDVVPQSPRYCVVNYGANDLSQARSQANMEADVDLLIATLRAAGIKPVILGIPPITSMWSTSNDRNDQIRDRVDRVTF